MGTALTKVIPIFDFNRILLPTAAYTFTLFSLQKKAVFVFSKKIKSFVSVSNFISLRMPFGIRILPNESILTTTPAPLFRSIYDHIVSYIAHKVGLFAYNDFIFHEKGVFMGICSIVKNRLMVLMNEKDLSIHKLAMLSAVPPSTIKNILYGKSKNPGIVTLKMLCDGLEISLIEFFDADEFHALEQEIR